MLSAGFSNVNSTTSLMSKGSLLVSCNSSAVAIQELCNPPKNHRRGWTKFIFMPSTSGEWNIIFEIGISLDTHWTTLIIDC